MTCLTPEQLEALARDRLAPAEAEALRRHVCVCEVCRPQFEECSANEAMLGKVREATRPRPHRQPVAVPADAIPGYVLMGEIHRGGQGVVYRALQKATKRTVAVKVLHEGPFAGSADRARFEREVQILASLKHPNIVTIHDSGSAAGHDYFVMDYIRGQPLDEYVHRNAETSRSRKVETETVLRLFADIAEAVNAAHLQGVIHRDLKPSNIRIDAAGEPRILDFGLAKVASPLEAGAPSDRLSPQSWALSPFTVTGQFIGSLPWASPEQAEGTPGKIDMRTDVYALGVMLYQILTGGRFPYEVAGSVRDVLDNIIRAEPTPMRAAGFTSAVFRIRKSHHSRETTGVNPVARRIDDEVETIVLKCLNKERERRYQNAGELARDIRHYLADEPIEAKRDSTMYMLRKHLRRYRAPLAVVAAFAVLLAGSSILAWTLYWRATDRLWESYLAQARARRATETIGRRTEALTAIAQAAAIRPSIELRSEAISALAALDVEVTSVSELATAAPISYDAALTHYALMQDGFVSVRRSADDDEVIRKPGDFGILSPDGRMLAVRSDQSDRPGLQLWDVASGAEILSAPDRGWRCGVSFHTDGSGIFASAESGRVVFHDLLTASRRVFEPVESFPKVWLVQPSPGGELLAMSVTEGEVVSKILLRGVEDGKVRGHLAHPDSIWDFRWSPDGRSLAVGCSDQCVYVWDTQSLAIRVRLQGHAGVPANVSWHPNGRLLASTGWDGHTRIWDLETGRCLLTMPAGSFAFAHTDGAMAYRPISSPQRLIKGRFSPPTGFRSLRANDPQVRVVRELDFHPAGRLLVVASDAGVHLWDSLTGHRVAGLSLGPTTSARFDVESGTLYTCGPSGLLAWPVLTAQAEVRVGPPLRLWPAIPTAIDIADAARAADGKLWVCTADKEKAVVFDPARPGHALHTLEHPRVAHVAISPDGAWVATGTRGGQDVRIWRAGTGDLACELKLPASAWVDFSPDGRWLVVAGPMEYRFHTVGSWTTAHRIERENIQLPSPLAFSPQGGLIAALPTPTTVLLLDAGTFEPLAKLESPDGLQLVCLGFAPDGSRLAAGTSLQSVVHEWDLGCIRRELAKLMLDWSGTRAVPLEVDTESEPPLAIHIDYGVASRSDGR